ncbi:MAG: response regulator transcription factor [Bacillota bacterium]
MTVPVVVCIDDERIVIDSLKEQLRFRYCDNLYIESAESGEEALELIEELLSQGIEIPLVICDYLMPHMKGDEVLSGIKSLSPTTSGILLTGQATLDAIKNVVNNGVISRYIPKPWDKSTLYGAVEDILKKYSIEKSKQDKYETAKRLQLELNEKENQLNQHIKGGLQNSDILSIKSYIELTSEKINSSLMTVFHNLESIKQISDELPQDDAESSNIIQSFFVQTSRTLESLLETFSHTSAVCSDNSITNLSVNHQTVWPYTSGTMVFVSISNLIERIEIIEKQIKKGDKKIVVWDDEEMLVFNLEDIICFTSEDRTTFAFTEKGKFKVKETLDSLEGRLKYFHFFRCHRSFLINVNHITRITPWLGSNSYVSKLEGLNIDVPISRNKVKDMKKLLGLVN